MRAIAKNIRSLIRRPGSDVVPEASLGRHVFFIMRYSLLTTQNKARWKLGRNVDNDMYRTSLFNSARMKARERLFRHITLPSLAAQRKVHGGSFTLMVLTSESLPRENLSELHDMTRCYPWISIHQMNEGGNVLDQMRTMLEDDLRVMAASGPVCYGSVWLDDDDAIARNYVDSLYRYLKPQLAGFCVSFPRGYHGVFDERTGEISYVHECYSPKIALGLAQINIYDHERGFTHAACTVYHVRNIRHKNIDRSAPTILDSRSPMYFRTHHAASDMKRATRSKKLEEFFKLAESVPVEWKAVASVAEVDADGLRGVRNSRFDGALLG